MTGRPTELTPEIERRVLEAIRAGNRPTAAFRYAGVPIKTGLEWLRRGRGEHSSRKANKLYADFAEHLDQAEAECEVKVVAQWMKQIPDNWQAARDFLARRYAEDWTPKEKHEIDGQIAVITADELAAARATAQAWEDERFSALESEN